MSRKIPALLVLSCMTIVICTYGRMQSAQAKIPFAFKVGGKSLPAGTYLFQVDAANPGKIRLIDQNGKPVAEAIVQTRLAQISEPLTEAHLVFDKTEEKYYLAEFWLPGEDGFFLGGTVHIHSHAVIHGSVQH